MSKLVRESISFERGGDPRKTMRVGRLERLREKYEVEKLEKLLIRASMIGDLEDVKFLVQQDIENEKNKNDALFWASINGHLDVVKYLVEQGADVHSGNHHAWRAADENGYDDVADYLKIKMENE